MQSLPAGTLRLVVHDACWPIWSADRRSLFFMGNNYTELYRARADGTGVERLATAPQSQFLNPQLSPDGSRIRFTGGPPAFPLWEIGTDGSNPHPILSGYTQVAGSWSSDGKYYFFSGWSGDRSNLWVSTETRRWWVKARTALPQQLTFGPMSIRGPAISRDGKQLYAIGIEQHGQLSIYDSKSGKFVAYLGGQSIGYVDFSRDGQWIAYVEYPEGTLWRSRIDGSERRQLTAPPMVVQDPRWSPDGKLIAFTDLSNGERRPIRDDGPHRIYAVSADGGSPMLLLAGYFGDPTWSPDGKSIAYHYLRDSGTSEVRILDLQNQKSTTVPGSLGIWSPRWSPDGKHLAALAGACLQLSGACRMKLVLFDFARGGWSEIASAPSFGWISWSRDSKFVYARRSIRRWFALP